MADRARDPFIRNVHLELAHNYDMLAESAEQRPPFLRVAGE
jgi:hypothetical protein